MCGGEAEAPVGEFVGGVFGGGGFGVFGDGFDRGAEGVFAFAVVAVLFEEGEAGHEVGGLEDDFFPLGEGLFRGILAVGEFGVVDRVGLLPDEERGDGGGGIAAIGADHFGPADAVVTLADGGGFGDGHDAGVEVERGGEEGEAVPGGEVDAMPPVHFEVGFSVPTVEKDAGLGRGHGACAVEGGDILGEDGAAFEFVGAGVGAGGEVDDAAGGPEIGPMSGGGVEGVIEGGERGISGSGGEEEDEFEEIIAGEEGVFVLGDLIEMAAFFLEVVVDGIVIIVEGAMHAGSIGIGNRFEAGGVLVGGVPVGHVDVAGGVGEEDFCGDLLFGEEGGFDADGKGVEDRVDGGADAHGLAEELEGGGDGAGPEVEGLVDVGEIGRGGGRAIRFFEEEGDATEVEVVGVFAEVVVEGGLAGGGGGVADGAAVGVEVFHFVLIGVDVGACGEGMPAPGGGGAEGEVVVVRIGKGLEAGDVGSEGEVAVAEGEGGVGAEFLVVGVVAGDDGLAVIGVWGGTFAGGRGFAGGEEGGGGEGGGGSEHLAAGEFHGAPIAERTGIKHEDTKSTKDHEDGI